LRVQGAADLPPVAIDADQMRHAVSAVLENAREAVAGRPGGLVEITARRLELTAESARGFYGEPRPGEYVEIRIADNGPGMSPLAEQQLFDEPFFSTRPRRPGFGLHLAYGVLAAHRGGLQLRNSAPGGLEARLLVPVLSAPASPHATALPAHGTLGEKVLVVDDDAHILQFACTTLEQAGYRVQKASSAADAIRFFTAAPADLVLSDVAMPEQTGIDLARSLLRGSRRVRMLFMSGNQPAELRAPDLAAHQFGLVIKPFRPDGLLRAVRAALDRQALEPIMTPAAISAGAG
jgi:CheY-like chemotaxis protein